MADLGFILFHVLFFKSKIKSGINLFVIHWEEPSHFWPNSRRNNKSSWDLYFITLQKNTKKKQSLVRQDFFFQAATVAAVKLFKVTGDIFL